MARKGTTRDASNKQEKEVAEMLGGQTVVASGAIVTGKQIGRAHV